MKLSKIFSIIFLITLVQISYGLAEGVNIIFIVPDGLSPGIWSAVRAASVGYDRLTNFDRMQHTAYYSTYAADSWITDSAGGITAMMTGYKGERGVLNQDTSAVHREKNGISFKTAMEYAAQKGYATGIITNTEIYEATPAGCYAHHHLRRAYSEIAAQMLDGQFTPDLIFGGGRKYMRPNNFLDPEDSVYCMRKDGRDLVQELINRGYIYIKGKYEFEKWNIKKERRVLGLFGYENMKLEINRKKDILGEPGLWELTEKALNALESSGKNFFLFVEAGMIDHLAHSNESFPLIIECIAFDKTIGVAQNFVDKHPNTLLIVAADHPTGGGSAIGVEFDSTWVETFAFPGPFQDKDEDEFPDSINTIMSIRVGWSSSPYYYKNRHNPNLAKGHHTAEDCLMLAYGWNSQFVNGYMDNTDVYRIMLTALPPQNSELGSVNVLYGCSKSDSKNDQKHTAAFLAKFDTEGRLHLKISTMDRKPLFSKSIKIKPGDIHTIIWKAWQYQGDLPGLYRYEWDFNDKLSGQGTFNVW